MAKTTTQAATRQPETRAVATTGGHDAPAFLQEKVKQDAGKGVSTAQEDNLVPMIYIIQTNSPQCNKRSEQYIGGAEPGDIWLRGAPHPIVKGEEGITAQPCYFYKEWVEWIPRDEGGGGGAGFVARYDHDRRPEAAKQKALDPKKPDQLTWVMPNGNHVIETRVHVLRVHTRDGVLNYVLPLSGSGHSFSRGWMTLLNSKMIGPDIAPSWAALYRLRTTLRKNSDGEWFMFVSADEGGDGTHWVDLAQYEAGAKLNAQFITGEKKADMGQAEAEHGQEPAAEKPKGNTARANI